MKTGSETVCHFYPRKQITKVEPAETPAPEAPIREEDLGLRCVKDGGTTRCYKIR